METIIITTVQNKEESRQVTKLIQEKYLKLFGTIPGEAQLYIVGRVGERFIGTIGFELPDDKGYLSIPYGYDFDQKDVHPEVTPLNIAQSNRWTSEDSDLGIALVYAVCLYAKKTKKDFLWIEQTPGAHRILTRTGMKFHQIPTAKVALARIHPKDQAYYAKHAPLPYIMIPKQVISAVSERMKTLERSGKIAFDPSVF